MEFVWFVIFAIISFSGFISKPLILYYILVWCKTLCETLNYNSTVKGDNIGRYYLNRQVRSTSLSRTLFSLLLRTLLCALLVVVCLGPKIFSHLSLCSRELLDFILGFIYYLSQNLIGVSYEIETVSKSLIILWVTFIGEDTHTTRLTHWSWKIWSFLWCGTIISREELADETIGGGYVQILIWYNLHAWIICEI